MPREGAAGMRDAFHETKDERHEPPRPLTRKLPPADPFPVDALGDTLKSGALAIQDRVRAPTAICGQSVLGTANLTVQGHANVELPTGQSRPVSSNYVTVGLSGERKSAVDTEALWPVRKREAKLRETYDIEYPGHLNDAEAWEKARDAAKNANKCDRKKIKAALDAIGAAPEAPLQPLLTVGEPTFEGLVKLLVTGQPSLGLFNDEGGQFIAGHGMTEEAKLRTATGMSKFWDGVPVNRVRGGDGVTVLLGRRLCSHLMVQPGVAAMLFNDEMLADQGFLSRMLPTAPDSVMGDRLWREPAADTDAAIKKYGARLLDILEMKLPLVEGKRNELSPRTLPLSPAARNLWIGFHDHIERAIGAGGELESIRGFANKAPEHAARNAAVLTLVRDIDGSQVPASEMEAGIELVQHYLTEALRLHGAAQVSESLKVAQRLEIWLLSQDFSQSEPASAVSLPDIYQRGPSAIRDRATARKAVAVLEEHGRLVKIPEGAIIDKRWRRDAWLIIKE